MENNTNRQCHYHTSFRVPPTKAKTITICGDIIIIIIIFNPYKEK